MAFEAYKAKHGGEGPFGEFYDAVTGGAGLLGRRGLHRERDLTDRLIANVQGDSALAGLVPLAELGKAPMDREQHVHFRSELGQQILNQQSADEGYQAFQADQKILEGAAFGQDELNALKINGDQAAYANKLLKSGDPTNRQLGASIMANSLSQQNQFSSLNERTRYQVEAADAGERNDKRKELQGYLDTRVFGPALQDTTSFAGIREQLQGPGESVAPPSLVSTVLDYAGAQLGQSDDGTWSFRVAGLGLHGAELPAMTYSQLRNRLDQAHQGHQDSLKGEAQRVGSLAQKQGFGINGTSVSDLVFPLADNVYKTREKETAAPEPNLKETAKGAAANVLGAVGLEQNDVTNAIESVMTLPERNRAAMREQGSKIGSGPVEHGLDTIRRPAHQHVAGTIQRLPTND